MNWDAIEKAADAIGIPYFTRKKWRQRDHVPYRWRQEIIEASQGSVTYETFMEMDKRKRLVFA